MGAFNSKELITNSKAVASATSQVVVGGQTNSSAFPAGVIDNIEQLNVAEMDNLPQLKIDASLGQLHLSKGANVQEMISRSTNYSFIHLTQELNEKNMMQLAECFAQAKEYENGIRELVQQRLPSLTKEYNIPCMDKQSIDVYIKSHHRFDETLYILGRMAYPQLFNSVDNLQQD